MDENLSPEEQAVIEELKKERFENISNINWSEGYRTSPGYDPTKRTPKSVNKEKVKEFLRILIAIKKELQIFLKV